MSNASIDGRALFFKLFPSITLETFSELEKRGLLHVTDGHWRLGDNNNGTSRKLSQKKWRRADNSGNDWHKLIGLDDVVRNDRRLVIFVIEGSKDALAAAELARRFGILGEVGIVCALGSGYRPIPAELQQLRGRSVLLIGDNDAAGMDATQIVSWGLEAASVDHQIWGWSDYPQKDMYDFLAAMDATDEKFPTPCTCTFFSSSLPSHNSTVQPFNRSTTQITGLTEEEKLGIIYPFVVTKEGTGNAMSLQLARVIKTKNMNMTNIEEIFHLWFAKSRPMLPPDADESESLQTFYRQLKRVRFTEPALKVACERARRARPPFIPARDGDEELTKLAALHRELQRDAGDRPYICPVNVAQGFLKLRWPSQANYLNYVLHEEKVIECVERGAPNKPGQKGKPTFWRYRLPLGE